MKVEVEFTLGFQETHKKIDDSISKKLYQIRRQIRQYKTGERILSADFYKMEEGNPLFRQCAEFAKCFPEEIDLQIYRQEVEYVENDVEKAVAFVPDFTSYWCQEYDDISMEYEECRYCHAHLKELSKAAYIRPQGFVKRESDQYGVLWVDGEYKRFMALPRLYDKLIAEGISEQYFRPAYSKSKRILAYEFVSDSVLPEKSYEDRNYFLKAQCMVCGASNYEVDERQHYYVPKTISEEGALCLKEISKTAEYYHHQPKMLINRKMHDLIKEYVPSAQFFPVFVREP